MLLAILIVAFLAAWGGTLLMRRYALSRAMLDVPNARSSHRVPTPRGGGVAFVAVFLLGLPLLWSLDLVRPRTALALALGGSLVAVVGFIDDRRSLSSRVRFGCHLLAAALALSVLGGWPVLELGTRSINWGALGYVFGVLAIAWSINLYNFMDGIDGLAISQAVFMALGTALIVHLAGGASYPALLLAAACGGFLLLNWPPAKIFMGDAGSGFLGFAFALLALRSTLAQQTTIWPWLILYAVFVVDASYTLIRRMLSGQRWTEAHRSHAYQHAAQRLGAHRPVSCAVIAINLLWLLPLACAARQWPELGPWLCLLAWLPLLALAVYWRAGIPQQA
jgi:Fuc2NAc and GlcNAc transferase